MSVVNPLSLIEQNIEMLPPNIVVYGPAGIGKTSFAASAPMPIFLLTESGLGIHKVHHFPVARSLDEIMNYLNALLNEPGHKFQSIVIDSLDWLEPLIWSHVAQKSSVRSVEDLPYGKGYALAADLWRQVMNLLAELRSKRGITVILLSHCQVKRYDSPECEPYDRYTLKLHHRAAAVIEEWADVLLYAGYQVTTTRSDVGFGHTITRGIGNGKRQLYTEERPAFIAKNRYGLKPVLPMSWAEFSAALAATKKGVNHEI